jgi:hypothetical protein
MRVRLMCEQVLGGLVGRRGRRHRPRPPLADGALGPVAAAEEPGCVCPRTISYSAYYGDEPTIPYTLTYECPRCGKPVVEHGLRTAGVCYPIAASGFGRQP